MRFVVDYPSAIQPRLKAYLPFNPVQVSATVTIAFFAVSLYYTAADLGLIFRIPVWSIGVLGAIFIPVAALFVYARSFAGETTLGYWSYIKGEMAAHIILTFYVLSTAVIIWGSLGDAEKLLYSLFFLFSFLFYVTSALDIRVLIKDLRVKTRVETHTIARYAVAVFSSFFVIFFLVLLTKGKPAKPDIFFETYPYFPLTLIGIFLIFYFAFLRRTHRGFEELMQRGVMTAVSYFLGLGVFLVLFILYLRVGPSSVLSEFPLFGTVFIGYFAILVTEVYSTTTLRVKEVKEKTDIIDLLNHVAGHFFRTDVLEEMWDRVVDTYRVLDPELEKARFYPPSRTFYLDMVNERARVAASVAMVLEMDRAASEEGAPVVPFDDDVREEIKKLLGEKALLLPPELAADFKSETYYLKLLEGTLNRINDAIKPFVSAEDYGAIIKKLGFVDEFFRGLSIDVDKVRITGPLEINRKEFIKHLKTYIQALGEAFPFNRMLLRETVKNEVETRLYQYGFTQADVLNVVPTGVKEIDEVLYGGLIKGTSTLFLSEERRAKNDVLIKFAAEGLREKEPVVLATSRVASKDLLEIFERTALPRGGLEIIDLYMSIHTETAVSAPVRKENRQIISSSLIQVRQAVVGAIKGHPKETHKRIVLDIYSDLSRYHSTEEVANLIIRQVDGFKRWNVTSIITLSPNLSSPQLEQHFDNVFRLSDVATVRVKKLFGGRPKKETFIIWGTYSPMEEPDYSLFLES